MIRNAPKEAAVFGVDLGKNLFHVVGLDARGGVVQRAKFRRDTVLAFFQRAAPTLVGMEACPGSQWFARKLQAFGHEVRIVPGECQNFRLWSGIMGKQGVPYVSTQRACNTE